MFVVSNWLLPTWRWPMSCWSSAGFAADHLAAFSSRETVRRIRRRAVGPTNIDRDFFSASVCCPTPATFDATRRGIVSGRRRTDHWTSTHFRMLEVV